MQQAQQSYVPQPEAAQILARLVQFGYAPGMPSDAPQAWQYVYASVVSHRTLGRDARNRAFSSALDGLPFAYEMQMEVNDLMPEVNDRSRQNRILYSAEDALHDPPHLDWCIAGLLAQPSLTVLVGDPGTKKTYLALDLATCVAFGKQWLGRPVSQCPALIVDEESGLHQLWGRLNSSLQAHQGDWYTQLHFQSLAGYDLRSSKDAEELTNRALSVDARLIVIDSLANIMQGGGDNNPASVQPVLFHLRRMAEYCRAAVVVIHHTNRHGVFRGSSTISAAADLMLEVRSAPNDALIELHTIKARFVAPLPFSARAHFETAPDGKPRFHLTAAEQKPVPTKPQLSQASTDPEGTAYAILQFLSSHQSSTRGNIAASLPTTGQSTIRNVLHQLMKSGLIKRANAGGKGKDALYELSKPNGTNQ